METRSSRYTWRTFQTSRLSSCQMVTQSVSWTSRTSKIWWLKSISFSLDSIRNSCNCLRAETVSLIQWTTRLVKRRLIGSKRYISISNSTTIVFVSFDIYNHPLTTWRCWHYVRLFDVIHTLVIMMLMHEQENRLLMESIDNYKKLFGSESISVSYSGIIEQVTTTH